MKQKIFFPHWFYFVGGIFMIAITVMATVLAAVVLAAQNSLCSVDGYLIIIFFISLTVFMVIVAGYYMFQFTVITQDGIKVRCVWCTIRKLKWEEIKDVRLEKFFVSVKGGVSTQWYLFDDGMERKIVNGIAHKNSHIMLKYSERAKKTVEEFWQKEIKEAV